MVLLFLILLGSAANILLTLELRRHVASFPPVKQQRSDLPCAAIPTRLILEDPECAQKLLTVMNVTNVRVVSNLSRFRGLDP